MRLTSVLITFALSSSFALSAAGCGNNGDDTAEGSGVDDDCAGEEACGDGIEGNDAGECEDGVDNDGDSLTDCDDDDCAEEAACGDGIEGNDAGECEDGVDNDGDSLTDCDDDDCADFDGCDDDEGDEPDECSDGEDNDSDGLTDCEDEGCAGSPDCDDDDGLATMTGPHGGSMIRISAGTFDMGCTPGQSNCESDESPVMPVTLTHDYYIGETEVTQGQYEAMMGSNPSYTPSCGSTCPVESVNWHMAAAFTNAVSTAAGLTECYACNGSGSSVSCGVGVDPYTCDGYRLPTEAEWEGAARCGEDLLYAGSNTLGDVGWYNRNSGSQAHTVASKDPNACGLYDLSGNVWEWTQDWYDSGYYSSSGRTDPTGATIGFNRVFRGGSWYNSNRADLRVARRASLAPTYFFDYLGFRLARTIP
jgi:formylglycine-generating enzyme required for sulfatase activity